MHESVPRVAYARYHENICLIYSQLCITVECLLKTLLAKIGCSEEDIKKKNHKLQQLLEDIKSFNKEQCQIVYNLLQKHNGLFESFSTNSIFINTRYMESKTEIAIEHIHLIWNLVLDIYKVYYQMYKNFSIIDNVYSDSMCEKFLY